MNGVFAAAAATALIFGIIVGIQQGSWLAGLLTYMIGGAVLIVAAGYIFTPYLRDPRSDEG